MHASFSGRRQVWELLNYNSQRGFTEHWEKKGMHQMFLELLKFCHFGSQQRVRVILDKFQEIKTKVNKKDRGQSVYPVQTDGCVYVDRGVTQRDFQSSRRHICQENASGWQKVETLYWVNIQQH